ncbi:unnamed protein product [Cylindrotheca closterium]|uniref:DUF445 domain-containing protein n=1 Tax=Cylindrotheca closterium TaxID=2856 RepID=A0AAD2JLP5_9STRA|nr:unnamed protein product [Cylindrotheca closterium]
MLLMMMIVSTPQSVVAFHHSPASTRTTTRIPFPSATTIQIRSAPNSLVTFTRDRVRLTTKVSSSDGEEKRLGVFQKAIAKFKARPGTYMTIPIIAAIVGWFTNYLAVQMIFFPIEFRGIPLYRLPEVPLGLLGWQGIVPCKTKAMTVAIVDMVTSQLLTVHEAFARLDPNEVAALLSTRVGLLGDDIIHELYPKSIGTWPVSLWNRIQTKHASLLQNFSKGYLTKMVADMQHNIDSIFSLENCVVEQMVQDRAKLGELFQKVGQKELDFLTNSGLWFGFVLGLIQMGVALVWENPWSLSIGGGIVGLATNWLALKWIFEPINPTKVGPFVLQGQFLRRQKEVSAEFSKFFATKILNSPKLWDSMLHDPSTTPALHQLLSKHFRKFCTLISFGLFKGKPDANTVNMVTQTAMDKLPNHVHVLHKYIDKTLGLQETLRIKMEAMSPAKFERVLHPIFEEDELTLILAGAVLGFAAGLVQQGIETGKIQLKNPLVMLQDLIQRIRGRGKGKGGGSDETGE